MPLIAVLALLGSTAWAQPEGELPFLRGVSIEKPTFLAFEHSEYEWVNWAGCKDILEDHYARLAKPLPGNFNHEFGPLDDKQGAAKRAGDRAACMAVAAMSRLPGMNVIRVPIEPGVRFTGGWFPTRIGDSGFFSKRTKARRQDYFKALVDPILEVVDHENAVRSPDQRVRVILDWHYIAAGDGMGEGWDRPWPWRSVRRTTTSFWEMVAETYAARDGLIFEVFNEPVLPDSDAGDARERAEEQWTEGLERSVSALREAGAKHIVIGAPRWSGRGQEVLTDDPPAEWWMQAEHCYTNKVACRGEKPERAGCLAGSSQCGPVFATEVGADDGDLQDEAMDPTTTVHMNELLNAYDPQNPEDKTLHHGWVAWAFAPEQAHKPALLDASGCTENKPCRLDQLGWTEWGKVVHARLGAAPSSVTTTTTKPAPAPVAE